MEILFLRHGTAEHLLRNEVAGHAWDSRLTAEGIDEATQRGLAWEAVGYTPDIADSSPLPRCMISLTIELAHSNNGGLTINPDERLLEKCQGELEGLPLDEAFNTDVLADLEHKGGNWRAPGYNKQGFAGESLCDVSSRFLGYIAARFALSISGDYSNPLKVVACSSINAMKTGFASLELGGLNKPVDPHDLHRGFTDWPKIDPCGEQLVVVEASPSGELRHRFLES